MELPGILQIGNQYFIKIDESAVYLPESVTRIQEALGYLLMYYYILNLNFPDALKFVFVFFEHLFDIEPSIDSVVVKRLIGSFV